MNNYVRNYIATIMRYNDDNKIIAVNIELQDIVNCVIKQSTITDFYNFDNTLIHDFLLRLYICKCVLEQSNIPHMWDIWNIARNKVIAVWKANETILNKHKCFDSDRIYPYACKWLELIGLNEIDHIVSKKIKDSVILWKLSN